MKTGLFFGSFNPIHIGHMALANYFIEFTELDALWFVISPHNPLKKKESLLNDQMRLEMVDLAIANDDRFVSCDIEFRMPKPSYTIDTLAYLREKYPRNEFILIMGSDSLSSFDKWKNHEEIIRLHHRFIYPRDTDEPTDLSGHRNVTYLENAPKIGISSSFIRDALKARKNMKHFLPPAVYEYISKYALYSSGK